MNNNKLSKKMLRENLGQENYKLLFLVKIKIKIKRKIKFLNNFNRIVIIMKKFVLKVIMKQLKIF